MAAGDDPLLLVNIRIIIQICYGKNDFNKSGFRIGGRGDRLTTRADNTLVFIIKGLLVDNARAASIIFSQ